MTPPRGRLAQPAASVAAAVMRPAAASSSRPSRDKRRQVQKIGVLLGDEVVSGAPGDLIFKPRGQWHTFWNAGSEPARVLEIISPAGFEGYFEQLSDLLAAEGAPPDPVKVGVIADGFGLELDLASIPRLTAEHGLSFGRDAG